MTLILFLSLGNSNKSIPSEGLIKGLCGKLYAAGVKSGYGRRAVWLNNSCFLSAKLAVLFGKSKKSALCQIYTCALTVCGSQSACMSDYTNTPVCLHVWLFARLSGKKWKHTLVQNKHTLAADYILNKLHYIMPHWTVSTNVEMAQTSLEKNNCALHIQQHLIK